MTSCIEVMWPNHSRHFYRSCLDIQDHRAAKRMPTIFTKYTYSPPQTEAESRRLILNAVSAVQSQHCETDALSNRQPWECEMSFTSWNVILKTHCNQDCFFTCTYDAVLHVCSLPEGSEVNSGSCLAQGHLKTMIQGPVDTPSQRRPPSSWDGLSSQQYNLLVLNKQPKPVTLKVKPNQAKHVQQMTDRGLFYVSERSRKTNLWWLLRCRDLDLFSLLDAMNITSSKLMTGMSQIQFVGKVLVFGIAERHYLDYETGHFKRIVIMFEPYSTK